MNFSYYIKHNWKRNCGPSQLTKSRNGVSNKEPWARRITPCEQSFLLSSCLSRGRRGGSTGIASRLWSRHSLSLQASSPGALAAGREKEGQLATASLEFEYLHRKSRCEMMIDTCFSMFVYIRAHFRFALIGGNLTVQSTGSRRGNGGGIQIPET